MMDGLMDPPKKNYMELAEKLYKLYKIIDDDNHLTKIGNDISYFSSISLNRSLFLIYAFQLYCAKEASIILAMLDNTGGRIDNLFYKSDTICKSDCKKSSSKNLIKKLAQKEGDHLTLWKIYEDYRSSTDREAWIFKYGAKPEIFNKIAREANSYYYKLINLSKAPQLSRVSQIDTKKKILQALKLSHKHLTAKKMVPIFAEDNIEGVISRDSVVYQKYNRNDLSKKTFIYDEFVNINNVWQFNIITII